MMVFKMEASNLPIVANFMKAIKPEWWDDNGTFALEHKLKKLFNVACEYAKTKGYLTFRTAMGSAQFSIHDRPLGDIGEEIRNLKSYGRIDFDWLLSYGFKVVGIQPHALGKNYHCIQLTKDLTD